MRYGWLPDKILVNKVTLRKVTLTEEGDIWGGVESSYTDYPDLKCLLRIVTLDDLRFMPVGIIDVGDIRVLMKWEYTVGAVTFSPEINDEIIYDNKRYSIYRVIPHLSHSGDKLFKEVWAREEGVIT